MRVLHLCCDPGIPYGGNKGASVHLAVLAKALAAEGAEVLLAVPRVEPGSTPPPPGVTVETLPGPGRGATLDERLAAEPALTEWLAARMADGAVDVLYERSALFTAAGAGAAALAGVPHLVELNAPLPYEAARYRTLEDPALARQLEQQVITAADAVLAVSPPLVDYAAALGARRVELCPNAVEGESFAVAAHAAAEPPVAVFAGALRPWHGVETLAEAWRVLGSDAPRLVVVGEGSGSEQLAAAGAQLLGRMPHHQVPAVLAGAQIGLAPYPADAPRYFSPLKVFEYLAAGLAVVATDLPGVTEVTPDAVVTVPAGDPHRLAGAVAALVADPGRRARLGAAGRELVLSRHTWAHRARMVLGLAEELRPVAARRQP